MSETQRPDVVDILTQDHRQVLDLLTTIADAPDPQTRQALADTVIAEIVRHSVAEEMWVYPAMRAHLPDGDAEVKHDIKEHQELEATLKKLERTSAADAGFAELVDQVSEQLRHHAEDEEQKQFPQLRETLSDTHLRDLGEKVQRAERAAPTRPHPNSPHSELFHRTFGSGVGLVDKLRDAVSGRARNV